MSGGEISPGDVLNKLAQARATCSSGATMQALQEVETAREWMWRMNCVGATPYTHHAFGAADASLAAARAAVEEGNADAAKHVQNAILQAQYATQTVATTEAYSNGG